MKLKVSTEKTIPEFKILQILVMDASVRISKLNTV